MFKKIKYILKPYRWLYYMLKNKFIIPEELQIAKWSYSQFGEDLILDSYFELQGITKGFYVEIGAFAPIHLSNTYFFYKKGWRGLCVEPNPLSFSKLRDYRIRDALLNIAVSDKNGTVDFICDQAYSGIKNESYLNYGTNSQKSIKVECRTLASILKENIPCGQSIEFMSIDCEGHEESILRSNDWSQFRPQMLLVEDHVENGTPSLLKLLQSVGYQVYGRSGVTSFFTDAMRV